jgi:hypothetical protein
MSLYHNPEDSLGRTVTNSSRLPHLVLMAWSFVGVIPRSRRDFRRAVPPPDDMAPEREW